MPTRRFTGLKGLRLKTALAVAALLAFAAPALRAGGLESAKAQADRFGPVRSARSPRLVSQGFRKVELRTGRRIGFMFGTFDPPHAGHLHAMETAIRRLGLDLLVVTPNIDPSHKPRALPLEDRLAMTRLAVADMPRVVVMPFLPVDVLVHRRRSVRKAAGSWLPGDQCFWIVGGDWLEPSSRNPPSLDSLLLHGYRVAVIERNGYHASASRDYLRRVDFVADPDKEDVSSTRIRSALIEGRPVAGLLPSAVLGYIRSHHLYADSSEEAAPSPEPALALP